MYSIILECEASSGANPEFLLDQTVQCWPNNSYYWQSDEEPYPRISIDMKEKRVVLGVTVYYRTDTLAPPEVRKYAKQLTQLTFCQLKEIPKHTFPDFSPIVVAVSNVPLLTAMDESILAELDICATFPRPTTPNKIDITCVFPLEGQYLTLIKDSADDTLITINEIVPVLLGKYYVMHI
jgi:hypothetical protein